MADVLIVQADGQARSVLKRVLEEDGYQVACALDIAAALVPLYLSPNPLVVIVDASSSRTDSAALDLVAADIGPLGRHRYIVLAEPACDETLALAEASVAPPHCAVVRMPATPAQVRELVIRYAPQLSARSLDLAEMNAVTS
jgi:CheY-like chemotaxis protein